MYDSNMLQCNSWAAKKKVICRSNVDEKEVEGVEYLLCTFPHSVDGNAEGVCELVNVTAT